MPEPIATWNAARGVWERPETNLLCGHQVPFTETWPTSVSMRKGSLYPPPKPGHRIGGSGFSSSRGLLPTPAAGNFNDGESPESWEARRQANLAKGINGNGQGTPLGMAVQLLKTPTAQLAANGGSQHPDKRKAGGHGPTLADQVEHQLLPTPNATHERRMSRTGPLLHGTDMLLPTPTAREKGGANCRHGDASRGDDLPEAVKYLPTPRATDGTKGGPGQRGSRGDLMLPSAVMELLPTPSVADATGGHKTRSGNRSGEPLLGGIALLLPTGGRTAPPSPCGNGSPDAPRPGRPSPDGPGSG